MEVLEKVNLCILYDIYGELLTGRQKTIFEMYVNNDDSISEIGESLGITRQAANDALKSVTSQLYQYESKLKLAEKYKSNVQKIDKILSFSDLNKNEQEVRKILNQIKKDL